MALPTDNDRLSATTRTPKRPSSKRASESLKSSFEGMLFCFVVTGGGLAAAGAYGGLRITDLCIVAVVIFILIILATIQSLWLPLAVIAVWMFAPLVRRVVDWQSGGYESITALSLLPMIATSSLMIPTFNRLRLLPPSMKAPLCLVVGPVLIASVVGLVLYGPSSIVEAAAWLMPVIFSLYAATQPTNGAARHSLVRGAALIAALGACYGIYQYFSPPIWDQIWLQQSGMTSSMGRAEAMEMRVWGPLNDAGSAGCVWAMALVTALGERTWRPALRYLTILLLGIALCLTLVRIAWIIALAGIVSYLLFRGGRDSLAMAATTLIACSLLVALLSLLPGVQRVSDRMDTFTDLQHDSSYNDRYQLTTSILDQIISQPWGQGIGFQTAGKVSGQSNSIQAVDNGYANIMLTLGVFGGFVFLLGMAKLFNIRQPNQAEWCQSDPAFIALARTMLVLIGISNVAAISFVGLAGIWMWWTVGISASSSHIRADDSTAL